MEHSIDDHWSVAIKRKKLKDILLEKPAKIPIKKVYTERAKSCIILIYKKKKLYQKLWHRIYNYVGNVALKICICVMPERTVLLFIFEDNT